MATISKKEWLRSLKFLLFSISAGIVQILSFTLFIEVFGLKEWIANAISMLFSVVWNFTINRKLTFKSANNITIAMLLVALFYACFIPLSSWLTNLANNAGINEYLVEAMVMVSNFVLEFLYCRFIVYRNSCDTAVKKSK
ncbi:MAG: GtrA family protein [Clostridiales bacterium]|nr:GtrA family protein [Clostridiales bacterium]